MKIKLFVLSIFIELAVIIILGYSVLNKKRNILGAVSVSPINKQAVVFSSNELEYYFEPKASFVEKANKYGPNDAQYYHNKDSFNERFDYSIEKPIKTYRIVFVNRKVDHFTNEKPTTLAK